MTEGQAVSVYIAMTGLTGIVMGAVAAWWPQLIVVFGVVMVVASLGIDSTAYLMFKRSLH